MSRDFFRNPKGARSSGVKCIKAPPRGNGHENRTYLPSVAPLFSSYVSSVCPGLAGCRATWRRRRRWSLWRRWTFWRRPFWRACFGTSLQIEPSLQHKPSWRPLPLAALSLGQAPERRNGIGGHRCAIDDVELQHGAKLHDATGSFDAAVVSGDVAARVGRTPTVCELAACDASRAILRPLFSVRLVRLFLQRGQPGLLLRTVIPSAVLRRL